MKFQWNKLLPLFLVSILLSACVGYAQKSNSGQFDDTYPSQFLFGDVYILKDRERIDGNIAGVGTKLIIEKGASVTGSITLIGGQMEISGTVDGDINVFSGTTIIHDTSIIGGEINQIAHQLDIDPGAQVAGKINTFSNPNKSESIDPDKVTAAIAYIRPSIWIMIELIRNVSLIFINVLIVFLLKKPTLRLTQAVTKKIAVSWGIGLFSFFAVPFIALILIVSICLSPIGLLLILAYLLANVWAWTGISLMIGGFLTRWLKLDWSDTANAAVGSLLIGLISTLLAFIPIIGLILNVTVSAIGMGGIILSKIGTTDIEK